MKGNPRLHIKNNRKRLVIWFNSNSLRFPMTIVFIRKIDAANKIHIQISRMQLNYVKTKI